MEEKINLTGLNGKEIWEKLYNKELNTKKNILEYIDMTKILKEDLDIYAIETTYNFIYKSIDDMHENIKPNTIMFLKNALKSQLGKYVTIKDPKEESSFIEFFKEAYPEGQRRKDFTWVLMDLDRISLEQIWTTITYINRETLTNHRVLSSTEKKDIIEVVRKITDSQDIRYINKLKSLDNLNKVLNIKVIKDKEKFKLKVLG